ncbi:MAG: VPLPA-CTERM sorting domain-containing protein [Pseudomonadota bacterium]
MAYLTKKLLAGAAALALVGTTATKADAVIFDFAALADASRLQSDVNPTVDVRLLEQTFSAAVPGSQIFSEGIGLTVTGFNTAPGVDSANVDAFLDGTLQSSGQFGGRPGGLGVCSSLDNPGERFVGSGSTQDLTCGLSERPNPNGRGQPITPGTDFRGDAAVGESSGTEDTNPGIEGLIFTFDQPVELFNAVIRNNRQALLNGSTQQNAAPGSFDDISTATDAMGAPIQPDTLLFGVGAGPDVSSLQPLMVTNGSLRTDQSAFIDSLGPITSFTLAFGDGGSGANAAQFLVSSIDVTRVIPLPGAGLMLITALAGIGLAGRRKKA